MVRLVSYFEKIGGWQPFVLFEGQQVGDIIDVDTRAVLKTRGDCFEKLNTTAPLRQESAEMLNFNSSAGSFFLKVQKFFNLTTDASAIESVHLSLSDVSLTSASVNDLIRARRTAACPELLNPLELNTSFTVFNRDASIIGSVLSAKLDVIIVASSRGDVAANLQSVKLALKDRAWSELSAEAAIKLKVETSRAFVVKGTEARPIAFRPSHVRKSWLSATAPDVIEPFDPAGKRSIKMPGPGHARMLGSSCGNDRSRCKARSC